MKEGEKTMEVMECNCCGKLIGYHSDAQNKTSKILCEKCFHTRSMEQRINELNIEKWYDPDIGLACLKVSEPYIPGVREKKVLIIQFSYDDLYEVAEGCTIPQTRIMCRDKGKE